MLYVLDPTNIPGLVVVATEDAAEASRIADLYAVETGRVVVITSGAAPGAVTLAADNRRQISAALVNERMRLLAESAEAAT
jgi:chitinase